MHAQLLTNCLRVSAELSSNGGGDERASAAVEALVLALHMGVAEAAHADVDCVPACVPFLHVHLDFRSWNVLASLRQSKGHGGVSSARNLLPYTPDTNLRCDYVDEGSGLMPVQHHA